jgi:hypothetical protein
MLINHLLSIIILVLAILMLFYNHTSFKYLNIMLTIISIFLLYNCECKTAKNISG